ncbi:hypothetical protein [Pararcticibacter amylolyticus]|uniref:Uncharacterized protein n=1 Tax=Pararcticibacter amylolyticus TaxID=2173175 RepID=A0A2U2PKN7_9SPHI|nr:hypothetical protein [Pararcticibacter amylolyticus]PWG81975.1 hypothetical protein DDR33_02825 [Pararcticibacter amylolyticus]
MNKFNGQESFIHSSESNMYHIREELTFLENPDTYRCFLQDFYRVVISPERWPQEKLRLLHTGFEQIMITLDAAWFFYEEHLNMRQKFQHDEPAGNPVEPSFTDYSIDQCYPYLQENKWPAERHQRFRGRVQLLNQQEIERGYLFYEQLFSYQSQGDWKRYFNLWLEAALDERPIFSSQQLSAAQVYEHYLWLLKLTERVWLDDCQDKGLLYHQIMPWFDMDNYPVFSTVDFCLSPYREIYGIFYRKSLMDYKKELNQLFKTALDAGEEWKERPVELLYQLRTLVTLAECLWLIRQLGPNYPKDWNRDHTTYHGKQAAAPKPGYKYLLSEEMAGKPENYLPVFFDRYSLNEVFEMFFETTLAAMGDKSFPVSSAEELKEFHAAFLRLLEAAFLIQAKKYSPKKK